MENLLNLYNTFAIKTLGCKVNEYESQSIINELRTFGLNKVDFETKADIYIINTCSVTNAADLKSRLEISKVRKINPKSLIIVAGCYAQTSSKEIKEKLKVDIIIGNKYKNNIIDLINEFHLNNKQLIKIDNLLLEKEYENIFETSFENRKRAFIKIQDGCNFMCSYCIIPFSRGRQRSKSLNDIIEEIKSFNIRGFKEIVLTGVNTAGYLDKEGNNFFKLLKEINNIAGDFRIRISSVEPFQINDEIIELITKNQNRFCSHWHICLQNGSNNVLKNMNRKYKVEEFEKLINKIRKLDPLVSISTDYIAGFVSETDQDHQISKEFIKKIGFSSIHIFTYSKRKNTAASKIEDIHGSIKKERTSEIIKISNEMTNQYLKQFINKKIIVLFESNENNIYIGKSSQYFKVLLKTEKNIKLNEFIEIKVINIVKNIAIGIIF